jgi:hypothetical protein
MAKREALGDVDPGDLARDDVLDLPGLEEPEDVAVGGQEQQHDPQRGDLEPDADPWRPRPTLTRTTTR